MWIPVCLLTAFCGGLSGTIDLKPYGFEDVNFLTCHRVGQNVLVIGLHEGQAVLFGEDGALLARVGGGGPAAVNLVQPMLLGISPEEILLLNGGKQILAFDHRLEPRPAAYPPLSRPAMGGRWLAPGKVLLNTFGNGDYALTRVGLDGGDWRVEAQLFPMSYGPPMAEGQPGAPSFWLIQQGETVFRWEPLTLGEPGYLIEVHQVPAAGGQEQVQVLQRDFEKIEHAAALWPLLVCAARLRDGYAVVFQFADMETFATASQWVDLFAVNGDFRGRRSIEVYWIPKPLGSGAGLLLLDTRRMDLHPFPDGG